MSMTWTEATKVALQNFSKNNNTIVINRQAFIAQELGNIVQSIASTGQTPSQTLSRILQELRDEGFIFFSQTAGQYTLNQVISVSHEDLPEDVLENAMIRNELRFEDVATHDAISLRRERKGTAKLRQLTLQNYQSRCALCDISDSQLLVTSHIVPWALAPDIRGHLDNVICFCTLHDKLFEIGYFSMQNNCQLTWRQPLLAKVLNIWQKDCTALFNQPLAKSPNPTYLARHRQLHGIAN